MKRYNQSVSVSLTGGLGNQLFQLAFMMYTAGDRTIQLDWTLGHPRLNTNGEPEIISFKFSRNVLVLKKGSRSRVISRLFRYLLRQSTRTNQTNRKRLLYYCIEILMSLLLSCKHKKRISVFTARGIGYFSHLDSRSNNYFIGYFQSHIWANNKNVYSKLMEMKPRKSSSELEYFIEMAKHESPLVVHFRLGDYKMEKLLGILPGKYYELAIKKQMVTNMYKTIWAFSDEPELARLTLNKLDYKNIRWIPNINDSPTQTLEVMRYGKGYVIANSTFSWWGAFLSYTKDPRVIAPYPWFREQESPASIILPHWESIDPWN